MARLLAAARVQRHQARIDRARDQGALLDEASWDRSGSVFPGYHLTPRGQALGQEPALEEPGERI
jgi:hypothetical protein